MERLHFSWDNAFNAGEDCVNTFKGGSDIVHRFVGDILDWSSEFVRTESTLVQLARWTFWRILGRLSSRRIVLASETG